MNPLVQTLFLRMTLLSLLATAPTVHAATLATPTALGEVPVTTWKQMRDARVVKQDLDYSCGAASLATLLNEFYGRSLSEAQILKDMDTEEAKASFADMARVAEHYGFRARGLALSFEQLTAIKIPAVLYMRYKGEDHFSVLAGITDSHVRLADPSWGNRILSRHDFLEMWETRDHQTLKGKILLIVPGNGGALATDASFFTEPQPSALAVERLLLHRR